MQPSPERTYLGQFYRFVGDEPHIRRDGTETRLLVWETECAHCGGLFLARTPAEAERFQPNRRCVKHKRPGCKVKPRKN